jgi:hypothetical protein
MEAKPTYLINENVGVGADPRVENFLDAPWEP